MTARSLALVTSGILTTQDPEEQVWGGGGEEEDVSLDCPSLSLFSRQVIKCDWSSGPHLAQRYKDLRS